MTDNITEKCYDDFEDIYDEIDSHEKLLEVSSARGLVGRKREIQKELRKQIFTELSGKYVTPDQTPKKRARLDESRQSRKNSVFSKSRKNRSNLASQKSASKRGLTNIETTEESSHTSNSSSPQREPSSSPSYYRTGAFDEIRAEFSRKRRKITSRLIEKFRAEELKDYTGLYDADINLLHSRIKQLERENLKRKEIVSLREQNRIMKEKLAERERMLRVLDDDVNHSKNQHENQPEMNPGFSMEHQPTSPEEQVQNGSYITRAEDKKSSSSSIY